MELQNEQLTEEIRRISPRVKKLFYEGRREILNECYRRVAVVGSRRISTRGRKITSEVVEYLVSKDWVIVSGLAYGVDQIAHQRCVDLNGLTIAVLGYGLERQVGNVERVLRQKLIEGGGLILSEYPELMEGRQYTFPMRDRIVAGISELVLVVEAEERSGTMITASWAKKYGKKMLAVPGSAGADKLISLGEALPFSGGEDLKKYLQQQT